MSLTQIFRKLDLLEQRQKECYEKYASHKLTHPDREEQEDRNIYGITQPQILALVRNKHSQNNFVQPRKSTLHLSRPLTAFLSSQNFRKSRNRAKSVIKAGKTRKQHYSFVFKEDIYGLGEIVNKYCQVSENIEPKHREIFSASVASRKISAYATETHKKQRHDFLDCFLKHTKKLATNKKEKIVKKPTTQVVYYPTQNAPKLQLQALSPTFLLTQPIQPSKAIHFRTNGLAYLKKIASLLPQSYNREFDHFPRHNQQTGNWLPFFNPTALRRLPSKFSIFFIKTDTLSYITLNVLNGKNGLQSCRPDWSMATLFNLEEYCAELLHQCKEFLHVGFYQAESSTLLLEQFLTERRLEYTQRSLYEIELLWYFLRRFLLFDRHLHSIQSAIENVKMIQKTLTVPKQFLTLISQSKKKTCNIFGNHRLHYMALEPVINSALMAIKALKREMDTSGGQVILREYQSREIMDEVQCFQI